MMLSGYREKFCCEVNEAAVRLYDLISEKADQGIKPLHRLRFFKREESKKMKLMTLYVWHKTHDLPLFVPATPGSVLQRWVQEVADRHLGRMRMQPKVIETAGWVGSSQVCWSALT